MLLKRPLFFFVNSNYIFYVIFSAKLFNSTKLYGLLEKKYGNVGIQFSAKLLTLPHQNALYKRKKLFIDCINSHMNLHVCVCVRVCACVCVYVGVYIRTYVHTYIRTYVHTYICTYVHTYIRTYVHTYIRTYVHTYIRTYLRSGYTKVELYNPVTYLSTCQLGILHLLNLINVFQRSDMILKSQVSADRFLCSYNRSIEG